MNTLPYGTGTESFNLIRHLTGCFNKLGALTSGHIVHLQPVTSDPDIVKNLFYIINPFSGPQITREIVAVALHASGHIHPVRAILKCFQKIQDIYLAGTGNLDNPDTCRIREPHRTCQVRSGVSSILTAKGHDIGLKITH